MSQIYQILSKENEISPLREQLAEQSAGQFVVSVIAQELRSLSEEWQTSNLASTIFETIKELLRSSRAAEISQKLHTIFSGKN